MPLTQIVDHWLIFFKNNKLHYDQRPTTYRRWFFFSIIKCNSFIGNETQFDTVHLRQMSSQTNLQHIKVLSWEYTKHCCNPFFEHRFLFKIVKSFIYILTVV